MAIDYKNNKKHFLDFSETKELKKNAAKFLDGYRKEHGLAQQYVYEQEKFFDHEVNFAVNNSTAVEKYAIDSELNVRYMIHSNGLIILHPTTYVTAGNKADDEAKKSDFEKKAQEIKLN